ncbi:epimerase [Rhodanobacter sp. B04]|uniref:NAD-dependent epimerase/dehydratase family protein n=1 Tax=Rhodanobacter sp. B04 TaxID=1945860 RepID=UPI000987854A|nr:NAD-dependent epimerase/dehydratase family protein [Rhodanobacter sp. B04]OOG64085.1 epimerase [Rhodanobacter sp. B04]
MTGSILVLGAGGFIGQQLVRSLVHHGEQVTAASRRHVEFDAANVETLVGALCEPEDFAPLVARARAVVYLASTSTPGSSVARPMEDVIGNLLPLTAMLQALQDRADVDLLYLSSGGTLYASAGEGMSSEAMHVRPLSYHGAGKIAAEYFISAWCSQYSRKATIVRPSNVYGPGQSERVGFGIVPTALGKIQRNETLHVWGDGSAVRDYLYIDDLVRLITAILAKPMPKGARVINACSGKGTSLNELFAVLEAVTGTALLCSYETSRSVDVSRVVMDPTLAKQEYDFSAATPLHEGLRRTWVWWNSTTR